MNKRFFSLVLALVLAITSVAVIAHATPDTTSCTHEFTFWMTTTSHWDQCSICGYRQNEQAHNLETAQSETTHYVACTVCGYIKDSQAHTFELCASAVAHYSTCTVCGYITQTNKHLFENGACTVCGYADELVAHSCPIDKATELYHRYNCDECGNYARIEHTEGTMDVFTKNEFFHTFECVDCGYGYATRHIFRTAHDTTGHYDVCVECGYKLDAVAHNLENDFTGFYHDVECVECSYSASRHVGVKYSAANANNCEATCRECGITETINHDWYGFVCDNCNYTLSGPTFGIVKNVYYDGYSFFVSLISGEETFEVEFASFNYDEGDFVMIHHDGNDIFEFYCLVDGEIVENPEHAPLYLTSDVIEQMNYIGYDSNTVKEVVQDESSLIISFKDGNTISFDNFEVYDFQESVKVDADFIFPGERLIWYTHNERTYILDYWY